MHKIYMLILIGIPAILISIISMSSLLYSTKNMDHVIRSEIPTIKSFGNNPVSNKKSSQELFEKNLAHYNSEQIKYPNTSKYVTSSADVSKLVKLGNAALKSGKTETALFYFNRAINLAPRRENALYQRAQTLFQLERLPEALNDINKIINLNPKNATFYTLRGQIFTANQNYYLAISDYSKSIELNPVDPMLYLHRGRLFSLKNHSRNALFDYSLAIHLDPNLAIAFYQRAKLLENLNEITLAEHDFEKARSLKLETK